MAPCTFYQDTISQALGQLFGPCDHLQGSRACPFEKPGRGWSGRLSCRIPIWGLLGLAIGRQGSNSPWGSALVPLALTSSALRLVWEFCLWLGGDLQNPQTQMAGSQRFPNLLSSVSFEHLLSHLTRMKITLVEIVDTRVRSPS